MLNILASMLVSEKDTVSFTLCREGKDKFRCSVIPRITPKDPENLTDLERAMGQHLCVTIPLADLTGDQFLAALAEYGAIRNRTATDLSDIQAQLDAQKKQSEATVAAARSKVKPKAGSPAKTAPAPVKKVEAPKPAAPPKPAVMPTGSMAHVPLPTAGSLKDRLARRAAPVATPSPTETPNPKPETPAAGDSIDEKLIADSIAVVREEKKGSVSLLQRRLGIGYGRAFKVMAELEKRGIVGPSKGGQEPRDVLIPPADRLPEGSTVAEGTSAMPTPTETAVVDVESVVTPDPQPPADPDGETLTGEPTPEPTPDPVPTVTTTAPKESAAVSKTPTMF